MEENILQRGVLITIDGIDGAGKTTQTIKLKNHYKKVGFKVSTFKEPTNGFYGKKIRDLAVNGRRAVTSEEELDLFIKDRIEDCKLNIKPALKAKNIVIVDRYYFSSIAYQGAIGLEIKKIIEVNGRIAIIPNLAFILNISVEEALNRIVEFRNDKINHFERASYLKKVNSIFKRMEAPYLYHIDGADSIKGVFLSIRNIIDCYIKNQLILRKRIEHNKIEV